MKLRSFAGVYPESFDPAQDRLRRRAQDKFWICDFGFGIGTEVEDVNQGL
jgi:hypothetical protein